MESGKRKKEEEVVGTKGPQATGRVHRAGVPGGDTKAMVPTTSEAYA